MFFRLARNETRRAVIRSRVCCVVVYDRTRHLRSPGVDHKQIHEDAL